MRIVKIDKIFILLILATIASAMPVQLSAQSRIRVNGVVTSAKAKIPIKDALVLVNNEFNCHTNMDGKFSIIIPRDATLKITHNEYESQSLMVNGAQQVSISLEPKPMELRMDEVVVTSTMRRKKVSVEQTEINVHGEYLHLSTKYYVPIHLFKTDYRFIAQPVVVDQTADTTYIMRPVVMDGAKYDPIQHRWMHFGECEDPLENYIVPNNLTKKSNIYIYTDSVLVSTIVDPNLQNDYISNCYLALVTYHEPPIYLDSITIARGLVNPIRHFDYSIEPMLLNNTPLAKGGEPYLIPTGLDTIYIPPYELELQNVSGKAHIAFGVNSKSINYSDKETKSKIEEIQNFLSLLQNNPDATIKKISLCGYASPEGFYDKNTELAQKRTEEVQRVILSTLNKEMLEYVELSTESQVESWDRVAELLDSDNAELASKVRSIINQYKGNYDYIDMAVKRLPEYKSVIASKYLDQLRTVTYDIDYSIYMPLKYKDIKVKYDKGDKLTRYEYYVLIAGESDESLIPGMERDALEAYPNFIIFANRKVVKLMQKDSINLDILQPILRYKDAPMPIVYNQTAMALMADSLPLIDTLSMRLEKSPDTERLRNMILVKQDEIEAAYPYFEREVSLNRVILLLEMDRNKEAKEVMDSIISSGSNQQKAMYCYIYAICANRMEDISTAMAFLDQALNLDPSLEEIVAKDADLLDIYDLLRNQNGNSDE